MSHTDPRIAAEIEAAYAERAAQLEGHVAPPAAPISAEANARALDAMGRLAGQAADGHRNFTFEEAQVFRAMQDQRDAYAAQMGQPVPADNPSAAAGWEWHSYGEPAQVDGMAR